MTPFTLFVYLCVFHIALVECWNKDCKKYNVSLLAPGERCQNGFYYDHSKQLCLACRACRNGYGIHCPCGPLVNTLCKKCQNGTFSSLENGGRFCKTCTPCKAYEYLKSPCNATHDTICAGIIKDNQQQKSHHNVYIYIIVLLSLFVLFAIGGIVFIYRRMRHAMNNNVQRNANAGISVGSEASFNGSSYSSVNDPGMRRFKSGDRSTQSSLLSTDCSGSERPQVKRLRDPKVLLSQLPAVVYEDLGKLLNPVMRHRDWESLAGRLMFQPIEINNFRLAPNSDYTERLLVAHTTKVPSATIGDLLSELEKMERIDAANVLYKYDKDRGVETPV